MFDSSEQAVTIVKPAGNECMYKGCTCINGERATHGPELIELCLADTLHVNLHRQLAVKMNPEIADCGQGCNSIVTEMNVIDADLRNLCRLPSQLNYVF